MVKTIRLIAIVLAASMVLLCLGACSNGSDPLHYAHVILPCVP